MKIKVQFSDGLIAYQVVVDGMVTHYEDEAGVFLFTEPPLGIGCEVVNA